MNAKAARFSILLLAIVVALMGFVGEHLLTEAQQGVTRVSAAFPTGDRGTSVVLIEISAPSEVHVGQLFDYDMVVTNLTPLILEDVEVEEELSSNFKLTNTTPPSQPVEGKPNTIKWLLGTLQPKASTNIKFTGNGISAGEILNCVRVKYTPKACILINVSQPLLTLTKAAPEHVLICDPITLKMVVTNPGTGVATNVRLVDNLPAGLAGLDGRTSLTYEIGTLGPQESRDFTVDVKASKTGTFVNTAQATAAGGLVADASTTTVVHEPVLAITKVATREWQYLNRNVTFNMTLTNRGDWVADDTIAEDIVPSGSEFVSVTGGGVYSEAAHKITWNFGSLQPGETKDFSMTVKARQFGILRNTATATAFCAKPVAASAQVEIRGVPGVLLEVIDLEDPIELGSDAVYEITVTNQGTTDAINVTIVATIQPEGTYVSSSGMTPNATVGSATGRTVSFAPVPVLPPKAKVAWRVVVKAVEEGDTRFRIELKTRRLTSPVNESEATEFYQ